MNFTTFILLLLTILVSLSSCKKTIIPEKQDLESKIITIAENNHIPTLSVHIKTANILLDFQYQDNDKSIEPISIYGVGSTTKFLSALLILSYIEEDKIKLDDPVYKFIDSTDFKNINWFKSISVKNLLNHTSGIPDYTHNPALMTAIMTYNPPKDYETKIVFINAPDSSNHFGHFAYSNSNYVLLERIIEVISKQKASQIFEMYYANLGFPNISFHKPIHSQAFFAQEENKTSNVSAIEENYGFEGGAYASTSDLSKLLYNVFIERKILNANSLVLLTTWTDMEKYKIKFGFGQITDYGLGLMKFEFSGHTFIGHSGSSLKYQSFVFIELSTGVEIVLLTNCSGKYYNKVFLISILGEIIATLMK